MADTDNRQHIRIFRRDEPEYLILTEAARQIAEGTGLPDVRVADTYFDFGPDRKWTTICATSPALGMPYQMLSPVQQRAVLYGTSPERQSAIRNVILKNRQPAG